MIDISVTIQDEDYEATLAFFNKEGHSCETDGGSIKPNLTKIVVFDVSYMDLQHYKQKLTELGIASNIDIEGQYDEELSDQVFYTRFTKEGEIASKHVYEHLRNPCINDLMKLIAYSDSLVSYIKHHYKETCEPDWDNQLIYAKLYLTKQLIGV